MTVSSPHGEQVKRDIRTKYDGLAQAVVAALDGARDPARVWRMVEGSRPPLAYFRGRKIEVAVSLGRFALGARLTEVGCGTGDYTFLLARRGFAMTGVDLSPTSIAAARGKAKVLGLAGASFVVSDAEGLAEVPSESMDGVVSFSALRYVPDIRKALGAVHRVLRPGGAAVLDFPNRYCPWFTLLKNRFGVETHIHDHHYSPGQVASLMAAAGFRAVEVRTLLFTPYVLPTRLLPVFRWVDRIGERIPVIRSTAAIVMAKGVKG